MGMRLDEHVCKCKEGCVKNSTQTSFSVRGGKTYYLLQNPESKDVSKYIVDDCLLRNLQHEEKCDYLFTVTNDEITNGYFIELKGSDVSKAIKQVASSIGHLKSNVNGKLFGRIICSKFPKAPYTKSSHPYLSLMKTVRGNLIIKSQQLTESL